MARDPHCASVVSAFIGVTSAFIGVPKILAASLPDLSSGNPQNDRYA